MDSSAIRRFGVACAAETAIASVFTVGTAFFCGGDVRIAIVAAGVFAVVKNVAVRGVKFLVDWRKGRTDGAEAWMLGFVSKGLNALCVLNLVKVDHLTRNVLVHEFGHVVVGKMVYSNATCSVQVTGMSTGVTKLVPKSGQTMKGFSFSRPAMAAGGPLMALVCVCGMVALAHFYGEAYEGFGEFLYAASIATIVQHVQYAASAIGKVCSSGHDFGVMAKFGIDPRIWIVAFTVVPVVVFAALKVYAWKTKPSSKTEPSLPMASLPVK